MDYMIEDLDLSEDGSLDKDWTNDKIPEEESGNYDESETDPLDEDWTNDEISEVDSDNYDDEGNDLHVLPSQTSDLEVLNDDNENPDNRESLSSNSHGNYIPSFTGAGKCKCGCASFVGCGSWCEACGHSFKAHGPL